MSSDNSIQEKTVSREEVAKHNEPSDLWIILHGRAYDLTAFKDEHPGGPDILFSVAGEDGTTEFEDTFHSKNARVMLKEFFVGNVEGMEQDDYINPKNGVGSGTASGSNVPVYILAAALVLFAILYKFLLEK